MASVLLFCSSASRTGALSTRRLSFPAAFSLVLAQTFDLERRQTAKGCAEAAVPFRATLTSTLSVNTTPAADVPTLATDNADPSLLPLLRIALKASLKII